MSDPCIVYQTKSLKIGNEVNFWFPINSGIKQGRVLSLIKWIILMDFIHQNFINFFLLRLVVKRGLRVVLGNRMTDRTSNNKLYEKCGSNMLSRAIMRDRLKLLL